MSIELKFDNLDVESLEAIMNPPQASPWKLSNDEVADILEKAADLYQAEQVEWCANDWITRKATSTQFSVCAGGAIALAAGVSLRNFYRVYTNDGGFASAPNRGDLALDPNYDRFREVLDRTALYLKMPVPIWNDGIDHPKSKPEAIDMFRRAAKDIRDNIQEESYIK